MRACRPFVAWHDAALVAVRAGPSSVSLADYIAGVERAWLYARSRGGCPASDIERKVV